MTGLLAGLLTASAISSSLTDASGSAELRSEPTRTSQTLSPMPVFLCKPRLVDLMAACVDRGDDEHWALAPGVDVRKANSCGQTLLHAVSMHFDIKPDHTTALIAEIVKAGGDVNVPDRDGATPMMFAARTANRFAIEELVRHGGNVNAVDKLGRTALMGAAISGDWSAFTATFETMTSTPAEEASDAQFGIGMLISTVLPPMAVDALILAKADANAADAEGWTPLMCAVIANWHDTRRVAPSWLRKDAWATSAVCPLLNGNDAEIAMLRSRAMPVVVASKLLAAGADPLKKNKAGECALSLARLRQDLEGYQLQSLIIMHMIEHKIAQPEE